VAAAAAKHKRMVDLNAIHPPRQDNIWSMKQCPDVS